MSKKKEKPVYKEIEFDSNEEIEFYMWCEEAKEAGIISDFKYHPHTYELCEKKTYTIEKQLKTKVKTVERELLKPHVYTPDFWVSGHTKGIFKFENDFYKVIDVKGGFQQFHDSKVFSMNQKWMHEKHGIYVEKIVPEDFFKKTFCPEGARRTKVKGIPRKKYFYMTTVDEFLKENISE
jgi:hypothetical protein